MILEDAILTSDGPGHKVYVWIQYSLNFRDASFSCESKYFWQHRALAESCIGVIFDFFFFFFLEVWIQMFLPLPHLCVRLCWKQKCCFCKNLKFLRSCVCKKFLPVILFSAKKEINSAVTYNLSSLAGNRIYMTQKLFFSLTYQPKILATTDCALLTWQQK